MCILFLSESVVCVCMFHLIFLSEHYLYEHNTKLMYYTVEQLQIYNIIHSLKITSNSTSIIGYNSRKMGGRVRTHTKPARCEKIIAIVKAKNGGHF